MLIHKDRGFTLVEIMVVVMILGILFVGLYMGSQPYFKRARDTKRVTDMLNYSTVFEAYEKNFDTFPSNYGSGNASTLGYCLSEIVSRKLNYAPNDQKFGNFSSGTSAPPIDPVRLPAIAPCDMIGSYFYSKLDYNNGNNQAAVIAARVEIRPSGNYGTGSDLTNSGNVDAIIMAKKSTIPINAPDQLFVVTKLR